jgi:hypothetical protein
MSRTKLWSMAIFLSLNPDAAQYVLLGMICTQVAKLNHALPALRDVLEEHRKRDHLAVLVPHTLQTRTLLLPRILESVKNRDFVLVVDNRRATSLALLLHALGIRTQFANLIGG